MLTGGCNCGAVRYEVSELSGAGYCHCRRCQRRTGAAASPQAYAKPEHFRLVAGENHVKCWKPGDGGAKCFCTECGSSVFSRRPEVIGFRMGSFDEDPGVRPEMRQFLESAAPWEPIPDDGLPRYASRRPSSAAGT